MIIVHEVLVPQGVLVVTDHWQEITSDYTLNREPVAWWLTLREAHLNGQPIWWAPGTRDLLRSAADLIDGGLGAPIIREEDPRLSV